MRRSDLVADIEPALPQLDLDMAVADSQGSLGYILGATLQGELRAAGPRPAGRRDAHPHRRRPRRPRLRRADEADRQLLRRGRRAAARRRENGWASRRTPAAAGGGSSPRRSPSRIVEQDAIETLVDAGFLVVAAGGGGIPVVEDADGRLRGRRGRDRQGLRLGAARPARSAPTCSASRPGVDRVAVNFGRPDQRALDVVGIDEARRHLADGQFPAGCMGPKIEAALGFLEAGGDEVLITSPDRLADALDGGTGTRIVAAAHAALTRGAGLLSPHDATAVALPRAAARGVSGGSVRGRGLERADDLRVAALRARARAA